MLRDPAPRGAFVAALPELAAGGAEVETDRVASSAGEGLAQHRPPRLFARQSAILPIPGFARVARSVDRRLAADAGARPHLRTVHREYPGRVGIAWMHHDAETDVADFRRHVAPDSHPFVARAIEPVDAAVALLVEAIGPRRMDLQAMRVLPEFRIGIGKKVRLDVAVERPPARASIGSLEYAALRGDQIHVRRVARIDRE